MDARVTLAVGLALMLVPLAAGIGAEWKLLTPKMILRENFTAPATTVSAQMGVFNGGNETVSMRFDPTGQVGHLVRLAEESFELEPNETKYIDFTIQLAAPGRYSADIITLFTNPQNQSIGLVGQVIVVLEGALPENNQTSGGSENESKNEASQNNNEGNNTTQTQDYLPIALAAAAVIVIAFLLIRARV